MYVIVIKTHKYIYTSFYDIKARKKPNAFENRMQDQSKPIIKEHIPLSFMANDMKVVIKEQTKIARDRAMQLIDIGRFATYI